MLVFTTLLIAIIFSLYYAITGVPFSYNDTTEFGCTGSFASSRLAVSTGTIALPFNL